MNQYFFIFLFFISSNITVFAADHHNHDIQTKNINSLPAYFYKKIQGKIGNSSVTMDFARYDSEVSGSYYYDKIKKSIIFNGKIDPKGKFEITEFNEKNGELSETGYFSGKFVDIHTIEGNWTDSKSQKSLKFNLYDVKNSPFSINLENYHREKCPPKRKKKKDPGLFDELCTKLDIVLLKISGNDNVSNLINKTIDHLVAIDANVHGNYNTIAELLNSITKLPTEEGFTLDIICRVVYYDANLLAINIEQSVYVFGAAHPLSTLKYLNFDLLTGKLITLNEIFLPGFQDKLDRIGEKFFVEEYEAEGWFFEKGKFKLNHNFAITQEGILFSFDPYEIGPYANGSPQIVIPYKLIKNLINKDSQIKSVLQEK